MHVQLNQFAVKLVLFTLLSFYGYLAFAQNFSIGNTNVSWPDADRGGRLVQLKIYYPANSTGSDVASASGSFPLVVFAHGFAMSYTAYQNIWQYFVPKGYIFAMVDMENGFSPSHENFGRDILFAGKTFEEKSQQDNSFLLYQHHNSQVAFAGHSMGGGASILAASFDPTFPDAVIGLAPAETNPSAISAASDVVAPCVIFSGTADAVTPPGQHHHPIFEAVASTCKILVNIQGGAHCYFAQSDVACDFGEAATGGSPTISRQQQQNIMFSISEPFWEIFLKNNNQTTQLNTALNANGVTVTNVCQLNASVGEADDFASINIFPNPSIGDIYITNLPHGITNIEVLGMAGRTKSYHVNGNMISVNRFATGCLYYPHSATGRENSGEQITICYILTPGITMCTLGGTVNTGRVD